MFHRGVGPGKTIVVALLVAALPATAEALGSLSLTLEASGGVQRVDPLRLAGGTASGTPSAEDLVSGNVNAFGVALIAKTWFLEVGLSFDSSLAAPRTTVATLTPLAGVAVDVWDLRLELLAEYGGHRYGSIAGSSEHVTVNFLGVRPGISLRLPLGGPARLVIGAWAFARWNTTRYDVAVPAPPPAVGTIVYRNGLGRTVGIVGRLGVGLDL